MGAKCTAIIRNGVLTLDIKKNEVGYDEFSDFTEKADKDGTSSWYGDIVNGDGKESEGLKISTGVM